MSRRREPPEDHPIPLHLTRRAFARAAHSYDGAAELQRLSADRLLSWVEWEKGSDFWILDLGAGTGYPTRCLLEREGGPSVLAMDLAGSMLKACRKRCHHSIEAHRLALVEAEASELPFGEKSVDAVFSNLVLQWVQDFSAVMEQVSTVLKPGGDFWFATLVSGTLSELRQSWLAVDDLPHVNSFLTCEQIMEAVLQSGLHLVKTGCEPTVMRYDTVKALMSDLKNIGAGNRHREARRGLTGKTAFQTMQREYEAFRDKEGALPATYEVFYVHAKRIFETETG